MVLMSNGVGLVIEIWKISKAITVKFEGGKIEWVEAQSYKKSRTKECEFSNCDCLVTVEKVHSIFFHACLRSF